jgi:hypothetical protein
MSANAAAAPTPSVQIFNVLHAHNEVQMLFLD